MRVISGSARGTKLKTLPDGDTVRPTTDRVKESVFNIIQFEIADSVCLDIFCGSGALGIEALSRGALSCDFVDASRESINIASENLTKTHLKEKAQLVKSDFESYINTARKKFDIIFADPPYYGGYSKSLINCIEKSGILKSNGVLILESAIDVPVEKGVRISPSRISKYGKIQVVFYRFEDETN